MLIAHSHLVNGLLKCEPGLRPWRITQSTTSPSEWVASGPKLCLPTRAQSGCSRKTRPTGSTLGLSHSDATLCVLSHDVIHGRGPSGSAKPRYSRSRNHCSSSDGSRDDGTRVATAPSGAVACRAHRRSTLAFPVDPSFSEVIAAPKAVSPQRRRLGSPHMTGIDLGVRGVAAAVGGLFAGGLHAVTGPDHLAALLPLCMGRRWWIALYTGGYWGLGHGIGAALVGALAFAIRGAMNLDLLSSYMEAAVNHPPNLAVPCATICCHPTRLPCLHDPCVTHRSQRFRQA